MIAMTSKVQFFFNIFNVFFNFLFLACVVSICKLFVVCYFHILLILLFLSHEFIDECIKSLRLLLHPWTWADHMVFFDMLTVAEVIICLSESRHKESGMLSPVSLPLTLGPWLSPAETGPNCWLEELDTNKLLFFWV